MAKRYKNERYINTSNDKSKAVWTVVKSKLVLKKKSNGENIDICFINIQTVYPKIVTKHFNDHFENFLKYRVSHK